VLAGLSAVIGRQEKTPHELDLVRRRARSLMFTDVRLSQNRRKIHTGSPGKSTRFYNARARSSHSCDDFFARPHAPFRHR
jgi:hypothetical protein